MYGVPKNLDLRRFVGATLIQIGVGEFQLQFHFHTGVSIGVEGGWELRNAAGEVVDQAMENRLRSEYRVHRILGRDVVGTEIDPPRSITLDFDDGHRLQVFDDDEHYESFSIQPGDIYI